MHTVDPRSQQNFKPKTTKESPPTQAKTSVKRVELQQDNENLITKQQTTTDTSITSKDSNLRSRKITNSQITAVFNAKEQQEIIAEIEDAMQDDNFIEQINTTSEDDNLDEYEFIDDVNLVGTPTSDYIKQKSLYSSLYDKLYNFAYNLGLVSFFQKIFALQPYKDMPAIMRLFSQGETPQADILNEAVSNLNSVELGQQAVREVALSSQNDHDTTSDTNFREVTHKTVQQLGKISSFLTNLEEDNNQSEKYKQNIQEFNTAVKNQLKVIAKERILSLEGKEEFTGDVLTNLEQQILESNLYQHVATADVLAMLDTDIAARDTKINLQLYIDDKLFLPEVDDKLAELEQNLDYYKQQFDVKNMVATRKQIVELVYAKVKSYVEQSGCKHQQAAVNTILLQLTTNSVNLANANKVSAKIIKGGLPDSYNVVNSLHPPIVNSVNVNKGNLVISTNVTRPSGATLLDESGNIVTTVNKNVSVTMNMLFADQNPEQSKYQSILVTCSSP